MGNSIGRSALNLPSNDTSKEEKGSAGSNKAAVKEGETKAHTCANSNCMLRGNTQLMSEAGSDGNQQNQLPVFLCVTSPESVHDVSTHSAIPGSGALHGCHHENMHLSTCLLLIVIKQHTMDNMSACKLSQNVIETQIQLQQYESSVSLNHHIVNSISNLFVSSHCKIRLDLHTNEGTHPKKTVLYLNHYLNK